MAKSRLVLGSITAIALLTLVAPFAHAGGGMGAGSGTTACRIILNGANPPQVLDLEVTSLEGTQRVQVGPALMLCDLPTTGITANKAPATVAVTNPTNIVCYAVQGPNTAKAPVTIESPFPMSSSASRTQAATLGGVNLLCVQAAVDFTP